MWAPYIDVTVWISRLGHTLMEQIKFHITYDNKKKNKNEWRDQLNARKL